MKSSNKTQQRNWLLLGSGKIAHSYCYAIRKLFPCDQIRVLAKNKESESLKRLSLLFNDIQTVNRSELPYLTDWIPIVVTPPNNHLSNVTELSQAGFKNIFCEKPLFASEQETKSHKTSGSQVYTLYNRRFYSTVGKFRSHRRSAVFVNSSVCLDTHEDDWKHSFLPHLLDILLWTFPPEDPVEQFSGSYINPYFSQIEYTSLNKSFEHSTKVTINIHPLMQLPSTIDMHTIDSGIIKLCPIERFIVSRERLRSSYDKTFTTSLSSEGSVMHVEERPEHCPDLKFGFERMLTSIREDDFRYLQDVNSAKLLARMIKFIDNILASH